MFKISIGVNDFAHTLAVAGKCIDSKPIIPIMANVLISGDEASGYKLTSANQEMRLEVPIELKLVEGEFVPFTIEYEKINNAVSTLTKGTDIVFEVEGNRIRVIHDMGKFEVPSLPAIDYPTNLPPTNEEGYYSFKCNGASLIKNLNLAKLCVSEDRTRPQLCGVCLDVMENTFNIVSTSGFSFFLKKSEEMETPDGNPVNKKLLIPTSILNPIVGIYSNSEEITIESDMRRIYFIDENGMKFCARMIDGEYPNYNVLIPQYEMTDIVLDKKVLETMLRRASIFADSKVNMVVITKEGSNLTLCGEDTLFSTSINERLAIENENSLAEGFRIGCNLIHLNNVLSAIETDKVIFRFSEPTKAFLVSEQSGDDDKILLLMPMRINSQVSN